MSDTHDQRATRPFIQRVRVGSFYADGSELWEVIEVHPLGVVVLKNAAAPLEEQRETSVEGCREVGIDAFRRKFWLASGPADPEAQP